MPLTWITGLSMSKWLYWTKHYYQHQAILCIEHSHEQVTASPTAFTVKPVSAHLHSHITTDMNSLILASNNCEWRFTDIVRITCMNKGCLKRGSWTHFLSSHYHSRPTSPSFPALTTPSETTPNTYSSKKASGSFSSWNIYKNCML